MEQEIKGIVFKGNSEGLIIVIPEEYSFEQALEEIDNKVSNAARFFKGAKIKVTYRGRTLKDNEEELIRSVLDSKSGAIIESFSKDEEQKNNAFMAKPVLHNTIPSKKLHCTGIDEGNCKFVRNTVRSGMRIQYNGNIVVMGDVNPGAEIIAAGNVVVLGVLRGMVHAGSDGNRDAFVYALGIRPTQIRIAEVIARMPEETDPGKTRPEIATVRNDMIEVETM